MALAALASACLLLVTLGYGMRCWLSPFGSCRKCNGMGHALKTDRKGRTKRGKDCRRCKGHGIRIRVGRHLWNVWTRTRRAGTR
jgi:DnaJ-class molecular chaperone